MTQDLAMMPAAALTALYRRKKVSPVEAAKAALARIEALNPRLNAYRLVDAKAALAAARRSEKRWRQGAPLGPVDGVPTSIKDLVLTKGWSTLRGSKTIDPDQPWTEDAPATARLREQGAVLLGKTTTPEFGWKGVTDSPVTGISRNPWNPDRTPGGSSGGAGIAAATGMGTLHIGTDGGGSIRIPSSFCGIFGFKQSQGLVPAYPASPFGTLAHVGPMTRTVADAALMLSVIGRPDARDFYAVAAPALDYRKGLKAGIKGLRVAFAPTLSGHAVDPEVAALVERAARGFKALGARVEDAAPELGLYGQAFAIHWFAGAASLLSSMSAAQRELVDPGLREVAAQGARFPIVDYFAAVKAREAMAATMRAFHERYDLLLLPTLPIPAFEAGHNVPRRSDGRDWTDWTPFTYPFNLTKQPAATVPCGFTKDGLPVGLQIVGPLYQDMRVLRAAYAFESAHPFAMPPA